MDRPTSRTVPALLAEISARHPHRNFVTDGDRRVSYGEFLGRVRRLAKSFHALGVRKGDTVALLMGNQLEWLETFFAVTMLGGTVAAVNTWWRRRELLHALRISDASILVMVDRYGSNDYTAELRDADLGTEAPMLRQVICLGPDQPAAALPFEALLRLGAEVPDATIDAAKATIDPEDLACLLFTSGSTARSKAAGLVHRGLIDNMHGIGERMHLTENDRVLLVVSLFWSYACANALFAALTHGASLVLQYRYDPGEMLRLIEAERCTAVYTQPNMVLALHAHPDRATRDLSSWRTGIARPQVMRELVEIGPRDMITSYGLTECYGNSANSDAGWPLEWRMIGSGWPLPGVEIEIVDPATRERLPAGSEGEIRIRGNVTKGYRNDPERTAAAIDAEGWFYTGDVGVYGEHGILIFRGRFKEMIKTGGINVTPADVEQVLEEHPKVRQAVVVGVPDPVRDEIVAALVVPVPGADLTQAELVEHCRANVAAFKVPRLIEIAPVDQVPLTDTGKVSKRLVQERLAAHHRAAAPSPA
ncbi:MAG: AMP-binding protein [Rhodospirillales bacterium]|nr:AMP-binding protein [Rhodospirillales bacterium]